MLKEGKNALKTVVKWGLVAALALYVVFPFDLMPEALLGPLGLVDDLVAAGLAFLIAFGDLRRKIFG